MGFFLSFFITKLSTKHLTPITANGSGICVCYFGLQTLPFQHKLNSQNNSTNAMLTAGAVN